MGVRQIKIIDCDHCGSVVDPETEKTYVDASVYGVVFHADCWAKIGGPEVARALYLDDISIRDATTDERLDRAMADR